MEKKNSIVNMIQLVLRERKEEGRKREGGAGRKEEGKEGGWKELLIVLPLEGGPAGVGPEGKC